MGTFSRTQLLLAVFSVSLCGLGLTAGISQRAQVTGAKSIIIDDGDTGFSRGGFKSTNYQQSYGSDTTYFDPLIIATGGSAQWTFSNLEAGTYDFYATWAAHASFAKSAVYSLSARSAGKTQEAFGDQTVAPKSLTLDGRGWFLVGTATVTAGETAIVSVSPAAKGYTLADAALARKQNTTTPVTPILPVAKCGDKIVNVGEDCDDGNAVNGDGCSNVCKKEATPTPPTIPSAPSIIIDDGDKDFSPFTFKTTPFLNGYGKDTAYFDPAAQVNIVGTAQWSFSNVPAGKYDVYATWHAMPTLSKSVGYSLNTAEGIVGTGTFDQTIKPASITHENRGWLKLGNVTIPTTGNSAWVQLGAGKTGFTLADAMMLVKTESIEEKPFLTLHSVSIADGKLVVEYEKATARNCASLYQPNVRSAVHGIQFICQEKGPASIDLVMARVSIGMELQLCSLRNNVRVCSNTVKVTGSVPTPACGNRTVETGEECDDGNLVDGDGCSAICKKDQPAPPVQICGNAAIEGGEQCDDGNRKPGDGCSTNCEQERCGDSTVTPSLGEECDAGAQNGAGQTNFQCSTQCTWEYCGDKIVQQSLREECDGTADCAHDCKFKPKVACNDAIDNDNDGAIDFPNDKGCASATDTNEADGLTDLGLRMSAIPIAVKEGEKIGIQLSIMNIGPDTATTPVTVRLNIPANTLFNPAQSNPACAQSANNTVICTIERLPPTTLGIQVGYTTVKQQTCTASIAFEAVFESTPQGDPNPSNNTASTTVAVSCPTASTAQLFIAVKATGTSDTAVKNEKNVTLLRFEGRAETADVVLTKIIVKAAVGSLLNGQNYALWTDTNDDGTVDTILQNNALINGDFVIIDRLTGGGMPIARDGSRIFEIRADIASSLTSNTLQLAFATEVQNYIGAELQTGAALEFIKTNGVCITLNAPCTITVTTLPSKIFTLANQGDLFVSRDSTPTRARQLLGGVLNESILRLQFRAQNEDIDVTDLQLTSRGSNASSVDRLELFMDGSTTPFATATVSGCGTDQVPTTDNGITVQTFCANMENRQLVVADGTALDVLVRPRLKTDEQGALSGQDIRLFVSSLAVSDNATGRGAVRARGGTSSSNLIANDGDAVYEGEVFIGQDTVGTNAEITGERNVVVLSKIASITNANPDPDNTAVPTGVAPIGQFKFTAAANANTLNGVNKATLSGIIFTVNATNVSLDPSAFKLYNKADSSSKVPCAVTNGTGFATFVTCANLGLIDAALESGEQSTFVLEANITNPKTSSAASSLQVSFENFSSPFPATSNVLLLDQDAAFVNARTTTSLQNWIEFSDTNVRSTLYRS